MENKLIQIAKRDVLKNMLSTATKLIVENKSIILTGISISSSAASVAVTYRNSPKIHDVIMQTRRNIGCLDPNMPNYQYYKTQYYKDGLKQIAPLVAPIIFFFAVSTAADIVNYRQNKETIASLTAALTMAQQTIAEADLFKAEATKQIGSEKVAEIEKSVEKEKLEEVRRNNMLPFIRENEYLCIIPSFGFVFSCTPDRLENAMLKVNGVLEDNGMHGRTYGNPTSDNGNEIVSWYDIFKEIGVDSNTIPEYAANLVWEAGQIKSINYRIQEDVTEWGQTYYSLILFTSPKFI